MLRHPFANTPDVFPAALSDSQPLRASGDAWQPLIADGGVQGLRAGYAPEGEGDRGQIIGATLGTTTLILVEADGSGRQAGIVHRGWRAVERDLEGTDGQGIADALRDLPGGQVPAETDGRIA